MCNLKVELNVDSISGYKIVVVKDEFHKFQKYYSPTTGIEYKVGLVEIPKVQVNYINSISDDLLDIRSFVYKENMIGRTCVILDYKEAHNILLEWQRFTNEKLKVVKFMISKELMFGNYYSQMCVVGGKYINNISNVY
jgi:hypothetical protein